MKLINGKFEKELKIEKDKASVQVPCFVAKINQSEVTTSMSKDMKWHGACEDSFMITEECAESFSTDFSFRRRITKEPVSRISIPTVSSKLIGVYRDKGAVSSVLKRYIPICEYQLNNEKEVENFSGLLKARDKQFTIDGNKVIFTIDVVADVAVGRDNVAAILLESLLELKCNIEDISIEITEDEIKELDLINFLEKGTIEVADTPRNFNQRVYIWDTVNEEIVHEFGEVPVLLENFIYQPQQDNDMKMNDDPISFFYAQCLDGCEIQSPTLRKCIEDSMDYQYLHELMICSNVELYKGQTLTKEVIVDRIKDKEVADASQMF